MSDIEPIGPTFKPPRHPYRRGTWLCPGGCKAGYWGPEAMEFLAYIPGPDGAPVLARVCHLCFRDHWKRHGRPPRARPGVGDGG